MSRSGLALCTGHSSVTACRDEGMRGSEGRGEGWMKAPVAKALRPVQVAGVIWSGCRSMRSRKRRTMKVSVARAAAAGGGEERS